MVVPAYEDPAEWIIKEGNLPENVTPENSKLKDPEERNRIARVFGRGLTEPSGHILPIQRWQAQGRRPALALREVEAAARPCVSGAGRQPGRLPPAARHPALRAAGAISLYLHRRSDGAARAAARFRPPEPHGRRARGLRPSADQPVSAPAATGAGAGRDRAGTGRHRRRRAHRAVGRAARRPALRLHAAGRGAGGLSRTGRRRRGRGARRWACRSISKAMRRRTIRAST